jgi:hypothetical protein
MKPTRTGATPSVGLISYPIAFQGSGGLKVQMLETLAALQVAGIDARFVNPFQDQLDAFDIVHVFAAINGNHRIVQMAKSMGCATVLSPLIRPFWTRSLSSRAQLLDRVVGKLTSWEIRTEYAQIAAGLRAADAVVGLGPVEVDCIAKSFKIPRTKLHVVPNGVADAFFWATPDDFRREFGIDGPFVLNVATVDAHKNQLALAEAMQGAGVPLVVIGECRSENRPYLEQLLRQGHVRHLGVMDPTSPLLASAYAAASVFVLPSHDEVMPLVVLESLAAGTPVVMTRNHCMRLNASEEVLREIDPSNGPAMRAALQAFLYRSPPADLVRGTVKDYTWTSVAEQLISIYRRVTPDAMRCAS